MPTSTTSPIASSTATGKPNHNNTSSPASSPLLFFVALGFGVVFTNLWIIVGVKYCFRYNQRNRQARGVNENGEPIDLAQIGARPHRRRREKKLMSMEEVNERFPLTKYKTWRSIREAEGLPAAGGVTAPPSRATSLKDEAGTIGGDTRYSADTARPTTALSIAQKDFANGARPLSPEAAEGASSTPTAEKHPEIADTQRTSTEDHAKTTSADINRDASVVTIDEADEDDDDPIRTAAPPEMLAAPGDTCAICLDTLEDDDDVRGLTCGHAFHAACVDPWLTSRRACCPLCKADYYIPKPRADGTEDPALAGPRMRGMPTQPPQVWIGGRAGMAFGRPRLMFAGPRFFMSEGAARQMYAGDPNPSPGSLERRPMEQDSMYADPATQRQGEGTGEANSSSGWRSRLPTVPSVRLPRFGRRNPTAVTEITDDTAATTPGELEAGTGAGTQR